MVARLLRIALCLALGVLIGVAAGLARLGVPFAPLLALLFVFGLYAAVLVSELVCLWSVEARTERPPVSALIRAWWGEMLMTPRVFGWRQPFRSQATRNHLPMAPVHRRGVLLVHGLFCNRGFWTPWIERLRTLDLPCMAIDLEPVFCSIETYGAHIDRAVQSLQKATGMSPVIVAHSMGGLAVRHWLQASGGIDRVHRIVTIGTPHQGTWMARFARASNARQMKIGSDWLDALASRETAADYRHFTCFYGNCDNVVFPSNRARLPGADNRRIESTAHVALAFRDEVFAETLRWLRPTPGQ